MFIEQQWGAFNPKKDPRIYTRFNIRQQIKGDRDEAADQEVEEEEELVALEAFTVIRGEVMSLGEEGIVAGKVETAEVEIVVEEEVEIGEVVEVVGVEIVVVGILEEGVEVVDATRPSRYLRH